MLYTLTIAQVLFTIAVGMSSFPLLMAIVGVVFTTLTTPVADIDRTLPPVMAGEYTQSECVALTVVSVDDDLKRQIRRTLHSSKKLTPIGAWFDLHSNATQWERTVAVSERTPQPTTTRRQRSNERAQQRRANLQHYRARKESAMNRAHKWVQTQTGLLIFRVQAPAMMAQVSSGRRILYKPKTT